MYHYALKHPVFLYGTVLIYISTDFHTRLDFVLQGTEILQPFCIRFNAWNTRKYITT